MAALRSKKLNAETALVVICCVIILYSLYLLKDSVRGRHALGYNKPSPFLVSVYQAQVTFQTF